MVVWGLMIIGYMFINISNGTYDMFNIDWWVMTFGGCLLFIAGKLSSK